MTKIKGNKKERKTNMVITSKDNETIKKIRKLKEKKYRDIDKKYIIEGVKLIKEMAEKEEYSGTEIQLEYSPESFTGTEMDFALEICNKVIEEWDASLNRKIIIN